MAEPTSLRFHLLACIGLLGFIFSTLPVLGVELIPFDATHSIENINGICVMRSGRFCKYDYGLLENLEQYWDFFPPSYDLSKVPKDFPFFFAYGGQDLLADEVDVKRLADELPGEVVKLFMPNYSHMDFVLGTSALQAVLINVGGLYQFHNNDRITIRYINSGLSLF